MYGDNAQTTQLFGLSGGLHGAALTHQGDAGFIAALLAETASEHG